MSLYAVRFDGMDEYVEADGFGEAVEKWRKNLIEQNPDHAAEMAEEEPEQVVVLGNEKVIR